MDEISEQSVEHIQSSPDAGEPSVETSLEKMVVSTKGNGINCISSPSFSPNNIYRGRGQGINNYSNRSNEYRFQPFGNPGRMPERWENYANIGEPMPGLPIVACRVPLNERLLRYNNVDLEQWFTPQNLMERVPTVGCIIDLTATSRYYDPKVFTDGDIQHAKIHCIGHEIPDDTTIQRFFSVMDNFLHNPQSQGRVVVVHCTHGLNRTGYLVARYLVVRRGYLPADAISVFNKARGYAIERENYLENLNQMTQEVCPNPIPLFQEREYETNHQRESIDSTYQLANNQQSNSHLSGRPWTESYYRGNYYRDNHYRDNHYRDNHYRDRPYADRRYRYDRPIPNELPSNNELPNHRHDNRYHYQPARERNSTEGRNYRGFAILNTDNMLQRGDHPRRKNSKDAHNRSW